MLAITLLLPHSGKQDRSINRRFLAFGSVGNCDAGTFRCTEIRCASPHQFERSPRACSPRADRNERWQHVGVIGGDEHERDASDVSSSPNEKLFSHPKLTSRQAISICRASIILSAVPFAAPTMVAPAAVKMS